MELCFWLIALVCMATAQAYYSTPYVVDAGVFPRDPTVLFQREELPDTTAQTVTTTSPPPTTASAPQPTTARYKPIPIPTTPEPLPQFNGEQFESKYMHFISQSHRKHHSL